MIPALVACLMMMQTAAPPATNPIPGQESAKMLTRTDKVTLVKSMRAKWGRYRFEKLKLELELPSRPKAEEYEPTEAELLEGVVVDYTSETEYETVNLFVTDLEADDKTTRAELFAEYVSTMEGEYDEIDIKPVEVKPFLGFETKLWRTQDKEGELPQQYFRLLAIDDRRLFHITVSGHVENDELKAMLDRILMSAKKSPE